MYCNNCGKEVTEQNAAFCANCGNPIEDQAVNEQQKDENQQPVVQESAPQEEQTPADNAQSNVAEGTPENMTQPEQGPQMDENVNQPNMANPQYSPVQQDTSMQGNAYAPYTGNEQTPINPPKKKKRGKVILVACLALVLVLAGAVGVSAAFFQPEIKMMMSSEKNYAFTLEMQNIAKALEAIDAMQDENETKVYDLDADLNVDMASIDPTYGAINAKIKGQVDEKELIADIKTSLDVMGEEIEIPMLSDGENMLFGLEELTGYDYYLDISSFDFNQENKFELTEEDTKALVEKYINGALLSNIPDEDVTHTKEDLNGKSVHKIETKFTSETIEAILKAVGENLSKEDDVVRKIVKRYINTVNSLTLEEQMDEAEIDKTIDDLADYLISYSASESADSFTYTIYFDSDEKILRRVVTQGSYKITLDTMDGQQGVSMQSDGETIFEITNKYSKGENAGITTYKGEIEVFTQEVSMLSVEYDFEWDGDLTHVPVGSFEVRLPDEISFKINTEKDDDRYVSTIDTTVEGQTITATLSMKISEIDSVEKPEVNIDDALPLAEFNEYVYGSDYGDYDYDDYDYEDSDYLEDYENWDEEDWNNYFNEYYSDYYDEFESDVDFLAVS